MPKRLEMGQWAALRIPVGPALEGEVRLEVEGKMGEVRVNGEVCVPLAEAPSVSKPVPNHPFHAWRIPRPLGGSVVIDAVASEASTIHWAEIAGR